MATVQGIVAKMSVPAWLVYAGLAVAVLGILCPWVSVSVLGASTGLGDAGPSSGWSFALLLVIGAAAFLAWPIISPTGSPMPANRLIGLSAAVGIFAVGVIIGFYQVFSASSDVEELTGGFFEIDVSPGIGLYLCALAVVVSAAGVVMLWINRTKTQPQYPQQYPGQPPSQYPQQPGSQYPQQPGSPPSQYPQQPPQYPGQQPPQYPGQPPQYPGQR